MRYAKVARKKLRAHGVAARYVGPDEKLRGATMLVRLGESGNPVAQFDSFDLKPLCWGWHSVKLSELKLRP